MSEPKKDSKGGPSSHSNYYEVHKRACEQNDESYIDPDTGYQVMTSYYLIKRGYCCKSGCRHCPYGFDKEV